MQDLFPFDNDLVETEEFCSPHDLDLLARIELPDDQPWFGFSDDTIVQCDTKEFCNEAKEFPVPDFSLQDELADSSWLDPDTGTTPATRPIESDSSAVSQLFIKDDLAADSSESAYCFDSSSEGFSSVPSSPRADKLCVGADQAKPPIRKRKGNTRSKNHNKTDVQVLTTWYMANLHHPFPPENVKVQLAKRTSMTQTQVTTWFVNQRKRSPDRKVNVLV